MDSILFTFILSGMLTFYPCSNNLALTFTAMEKQLFLFDDIQEESTQPAAGNESFAALFRQKEFNTAGEATKAVAVNILPADIAPAEKVADPFAEIQQKRQDEIDTLLLTPNKKRGRKSFRAMDEEAILPEVPEDEELFKKQYYTTRVVADWFGISLSQLRAWEIEFEILKPKKNAKGDRYFRPEDVKNLKVIYHLIRRRKFTVQGAKQYMEENKKKLQTTMQLTESLHKFKQFLLELKAISG